MCICVYLSFLHHWIKWLFSIKRTLEERTHISPHFLKISVSKTYSEIRALCASIIHFISWVNWQIIVEHLFIPLSEMDNQNSFEYIKNVGRFLIISGSITNHRNLLWETDILQLLNGVKTAGQSRESDEAPGIMSKKVPSPKNYSYFCYFQVCCTCHSEKLLINKLVT